MIDVAWYMGRRARGTYSRGQVSHWLALVFGRSCVRDDSIESILPTEYSQDDAEKEEKGYIGCPRVSMTV